MRHTLSEIKQTKLLRVTLRPVVNASRYVYAKVAQMLGSCKIGDFPVEAVTPGNAHCFFGYYDKTPWDASGRYLLCLKTSFARRMPRPGETAAVCVIDLEDNNRLREISQTTAWCWQQGAMLQWIDDGSGQHILYNDFREGRYVTVICDLSGNAVKVLPRPTYALSRDGSKILSLNFARLHFARPGYGYVAAPFAGEDDLFPRDDGIYSVDPQTGENRLIISLDQITRVNPEEDFHRCFHYFNHIEFSPDASRFVFYHRWRMPGRAWPRRTRMYTAAADGSDLCCLADPDSMSHFAWKDDEHILAWTGGSIGGCFRLYQDRTGRATIVGEGVLTEDGHPSYSRDGRWILTDTYPDKKRRRTLLLFDTQIGKLHNLGQFFVPFLYDGPNRCDLHPRWSRDSRRICFDSVHEGKRRMYIVDVSSLVCQ